MDKVKFMQRCNTCGASYQFGPHVYDGKYVPMYQINVCVTCWDANWDGWAPHLEEAVVANLKAKGLPIPARNKKGWLPRS